MRKVMFLDVDGVLNDLPRGGSPDIVGLYLGEMRSVVRELGLYVVISSGWRENETKMDCLKRTLRSAGIRDFDVCRKGNKASSVIGWLEEHRNEALKYVVVDDEESLAADFGDRLLVCRSGFDSQFSSVVRDAFNREP